MQHRNKVEGGAEWWGGALDEQQEARHRRTVQRCRQLQCCASIAARRQHPVNERLDSWALVGTDGDGRVRALVHFHSLASQDFCGHGLHWNNTHGLEKPSSTTKMVECSGWSAGCTTHGTWKRRGDDENASAQAFTE
jgi:hypothetical protein